MRYSLVKTAAVAALLVMPVAGAEAALVTGTYAVTGSNFASTAVPPFTSITESFTISFDNSTAVSQQTTAISLNASTITPASTLGYTYVPITDTLIVGGLASTVAASDPNSTDFSLVINNVSKGASFGITSLTYSVGTGTTFTATRTAKASAVPEPTSLVLLGTAATLAAMRRRRNKA